MKKLSEITSKKEYTWDFKGEALKIGAFTARVIRDMELDNLELSELFGKFSTQPTHVSVTMLWYLMLTETKQFFDNDVEVLLDNMGPDELASISDLIMHIYEDSQPAGKKSEDVPQ
jgi:hypothetical protein